MRTGSFIPNIISSPRVTIRNATPQAIRTTIAQPASTTQYMGVPHDIQTTIAQPASTSQYMGVLHDIHTTTVQNHSVQPASTAQLTGVHQYASVPQYTGASQYMGVPQAVQMPTLYPRAMPTVVQPVNTPLYYAAAPIINAVQPQGATHAQTMSIKDIIAVLPEYDPTSEDSLTSIQFVQRIQMLMNAYGWRDDLVIFATQQKLKGHAKLWADAQAEIFVTWKQFAEKIVEAFPFDANAASAHIKMANTKREFNENPKNFYFRMLAMGTRFGMTQGAIARHIINGINDPDLRKKISNDYVMCSELLRDIESYCRYNEVRAGPSRPKESSSPMVANHKVVANNTQNTLKHLKCYNCGTYGHIASKCRAPKRVGNCATCNQTTHQTKDCPKRSGANKVNVVNAEELPRPDIVKEIKVNEHLLEAFIDPGSSRSLIRTSCGDRLGSSTQCHINLSGFGGGQYVCDKMILVTLEMDDHEIAADLLLVEDELLQYDVLVGRDILCKGDKRVVIEEDTCSVNTHITG